MLLREARRSGVQVREDVAVRKILKLADGDVRVASDAGEFRGRWLIDASGQATVVGRHLKSRQAAKEPHLRKTAFFNHFRNVRRPSGKEAGHPLIVMHDQGWFWMIPLDETRTSVGLVMNPEIARQVQREQQFPADRMLSWGIAPVPQCATA